MAAQKISKYSLPDLKNTTDDALPNYLTSLRFKQSHFLTDVRLSLGYSAVVIAAATFLADYKLGWDATKVGTFYAVFVYFVLNGALTLWIWGVERGVVFSGERDQSTLSIASSVSKHTPTYKIVVRQKNSSGNEEKLELSAPFTTWFDSDGCFVAKPFQRWLATSIPAIGRADPQNAQSELTEARGGAETPEKSDTRGYTASGNSATPSSTRTRRSKKD